jgi:hypothetical protein
VFRCGEIPAPKQRLDAIQPIRVGVHGRGQNR